MSYRSIKGYIVRRMNSLGFSESNEKFNFDGATDFEFDKKFIVENPETNIVSGNTLSSNFYPERKMTVRIAWRLPEQAIYDYDLIQETLEFIIKDLHSPANFQVDSIKNFQFQSHSSREEKGYLVTEINFIATDSLSF